MKRFFVGTRFGSFAMRIRNWMEIVRCHPEKVGTLANDILAGELVTKICQKEKTFIDVGCHIGSIVAEVMKHDSTIKIIGFEPIPEKIAHLRRKFPSAEFHDVALGNVTGETVFYINDKQSGYSSLKKNSNNNREIKVSIKKIDDMVKSKDVDVIKIDVEGFELGVLQGGEQLINIFRPTIMFESGPDESGFNKTDLWDWFSKQKYIIVVPNRLAHNDSGLSQSGFIESHLYPRRTTNYFAVPQERRKEIQDKSRQILNLK